MKFKYDTLKILPICLIFFITILNLFVNDDYKFIINYFTIFLSIIFVIYFCNLKIKLFYIKPIFYIYFFFFLNVFFTNFYDFKITLNYFSYLIPIFFIYNTISNFTDSQFINFTTFFKVIFLFIFILFLFNLIIAKEIPDLLIMYHNGWYSSNYERYGINKLIQGVIIMITLIITLYSNLNKNRKYLLLIVISFLLVGSRALFFGLMVYFMFVLLNKYINKLNLLFFIFFILFFFSLPIFFIDNPDSLYFELDIRSFLQVISLKTFYNNFFGIGFSGWNEYALKYQEILNHKYFMYEPKLALFRIDANNTVNLTLESTFFQLIAEIGIFTFFIYILVFKSTIKYFHFTIYNNYNFFKSICLIMLFASIFEDLLFDIFWWFLFAIILGLNNRYSSESNLKPSTK